MLVARQTCELVGFYVLLAQVEFSKNPKRLQYSFTLVPDSRFSGRLSENFKHRRNKRRWKRFFGRYPKSKDDLRQIVFCSIHTTWATSTRVWCPHVWIWRFQSVHLHMKAPSGDTLPAGGLAHVTQLVLLDNPSKVRHTAGYPASAFPILMVDFLKLNHGGNMSAKCHLTHSLQVNLKMRIRISYSSRGSSIQDTVQIDSFPGLSWLAPVSQPSDLHTTIPPIPDLVEIWSRSQPYHLFDIAVSALEYREPIQSIFFPMSTGYKMLPSVYCSGFLPRL